MKRWLAPGVLALCVGLVFAGACTQNEFWDDYFVLEKARSLESVWAAFAPDSLGFAHGKTTNFWRPIVTLTWYFEALWTNASPRVAHGVNVVLHAANAVLAYFWLRRWLPRAGCPAPPVVLAGLAFFWAAVPIKAEAVGWISGRPDVLGPFFLLAGGELLSRIRRPALAALVAVLFALAAVGCKESMVAAPLLFALESTGGVDLRRWLRSPAAWASSLVVSLYLAYRFIGIGIGSDSRALLHDMSLFDRAALFLESVAYAVTALAQPFSSRILRGVLAFDGHGSFIVEPLAGGLGLVSTLVALVLWWKKPELRPFLLLLAAPLLPVLNLVPTGLENRMSERYLYLPSLGAWALMVPLFWGLPRMVPVLARRERLHLWLGRISLVALCIAAASFGARRAWLFGHPRALVRAELEHGERPITLLDTAAYMAEEQGDLLEARNRRMMLSNRVADLRLPGGQSLAVAAARAQYEATGEQFAPAHRGFGQLLYCLLHPDQVSDMPVVRIPLFPGSEGLALPCKDGRMLRFAAQNRDQLEASWWLLQARLGQPVAQELRRLHAACPECSALTKELGLAAVARGAPELALRLVPSTARQRQLQRIRDVARLQQIVQGHLSGPDLEAALTFLGLAPQVTCRALEESAQRGRSQQGRTRLRRVACTLAGASETPEFSTGSERALQLRSSARARYTLLRSAWPQLPEPPPPAPLP